MTDRSFLSKPLKHYYEELKQNRKSCRRADQPCIIQQTGNY
jgi:hypothetical protein